MKYPLIKSFGVAALAAAVAACGGSGSGSDDSTDSESTGTMSLGLTDAPVTDLTEVNLNITSVEVKPANGESVTVQIVTENETNSLDINLLDFQGGDVAQLFEDQEFPAGQYEWIRLHLGSNPYVEEAGAPGIDVPLFVPSGFQTGLKLQGGFIIPAGGSADFTLDFDVRKSIVNAGEKGTGGSKYILKPTHRLIDNAQAGSIIGEVNYPNINSSRLDNADLAECDYAGSVYVFSGPDVTPTDLNVDDPDSGPLMAVPVSDDDNDGLYEYKAAFLPAGDYTISYSCQADDNEKTEVGETLEFEGTQNVTVTAEPAPTKAQLIPLAQ